MKLLQASIRKISLTLFALLSTWTCGHVYADTPVRIAYPSGLNGQIALVADKAGIATRNGLQAQFNLFQNGPPMMEALASGNVDVVVTSYQPFTTFRLKQPDAVTVIAQLGHSSYALVAPAESAVTQLGELKGKRIALSFGSDSHLDLLRSIRALGLNPTEDFTLINLQPSDLRLALTQGHADAIVIRQPQVLLLQEKGARVLQSWPHYYVVLARKQYLQENPHARDQLTQTLREAVAHIVQNGEQSAQWFADQQRLESRIVQPLVPQNPIFADVRKPADVNVAFEGEHIQRLNDWFHAAYGNQLVKAPVAVYVEETHSAAQAD